MPLHRQITMVTVTAINDLSEDELQTKLSRWMEDACYTHKYNARKNKHGTANNTSGFKIQNLRKIKFQLQKQENLHINDTNKAKQSLHLTFRISQQISTKGLKWCRLVLKLQLER